MKIASKQILHAYLTTFEKSGQESFKFLKNVIDKWNFSAYNNKAL